MTDHSERARKALSAQGVSSSEADARWPERSPGAVRGSESRASIADRTGQSVAAGPPAPLNGAYTGWRKADTSIWNDLDAACIPHAAI